MEEGLHVPLTKLVVAASHQAGGSKTCRRVTKTPKMAGSLRYTLVHSRTCSQGTQPCISLTKELTWHYLSQFGAKD